MICSSVNAIRESSQLGADDKRGKLPHDIMAVLRQIKPIRLRSSSGFAKVTETSNHAVLRAVIVLTSFARYPNGLIRCANVP